MKPYTVLAVVVRPTPKCFSFRKKRSSLSGVTIRASLSPSCREGKKKGEVVQRCYCSTRAKPPYIPMGKDGMILRGGYCSCYSVHKLECSSTQCPVNTLHVQLVNNNGTSTSSSHAHHNSHMHAVPMAIHIHV